MVKFMADYSFRTGFFGKAYAILNKRELPGNEQNTSARETFCLVPLLWVTLAWDAPATFFGRCPFSLWPLFYFCCENGSPGAVLPSFRFRH
jgi:hypothetical protein